jgi:hypothetical protein
VLSGARQCIATSQVSGQRCKNNAVHWQAVCRFHGAAAPLSRKAAFERMLYMVEPAMERLREIILHGDDKDANAAIRTLFQACGMLKTQVEVTQPEQDLSSLTQEALNARASRLLEHLRERAVEGSVIGSSPEGTEP